MSDRHDDTLQCDVLVVGSGAGGLATAVTAAFHGLNVIVAEKAPVIGGTTAWSGGWLWIPRNPLAIEAGIVEPPEEPFTRFGLTRLAGTSFPRRIMSRLRRKSKFRQTLWPQPSPVSMSLPPKAKTRISVAAARHTTGSRVMPFMRRTRRSHRFGAARSTP